MLQAQQRIAQAKSDAVSTQLTPPEWIFSLDVDHTHPFTYLTELLKLNSEIIDITLNIPNQYVYNVDQADLQYFLDYIKDDERVKSIQFDADLTAQFTTVIQDFTQTLITHNKSMALQFRQTVFNATTITALKSILNADIVPSLTIVTPTITMLELIGILSCAKSKLSNLFLNVQLTSYKSFVKTVLIDVLKNPHIATLHISAFPSNHAPLPKATADALNTALASNATLKELSVYGETLTLFQGIDKNKSIITLAYQDCPNRPLPRAHPIFDSMAKNTSIESLNYVGNSAIDLNALNKIPNLQKVKILRSTFSAVSTSTIFKNPRIFDLSIFDDTSKPFKHYLLNTARNIVTSLSADMFIFENLKNRKIASNRVASRLLTQPDLSKVDNYFRVLSRYDILQLCETKSHIYSLIKGTFKHLSFDLFEEISNKLLYLHMAHRGLAEKIMPNITNLPTEVANMIFTSANSFTTAGISKAHYPLLPYLLAKDYNNWEDYKPLMKFLAGCALDAALYVGFGVCTAYIHPALFITSAVAILGAYVWLRLEHGINLTEALPSHLLGAQYDLMNLLGFMAFTGLYAAGLMLIGGSTMLGAIYLGGPLGVCTGVLAGLYMTDKMPESFHYLFNIKRHGDDITIV